MSEDYSLFDPEILDEASRQAQARKVLGIVRAHAGQPLSARRCLDIGCSGGHITARLAEEFAFVVGIDVDQRALKMAVARATSSTSQGSRPASYCRASAIALPFASDSFGVVTCNQVYQYVPAPQQMVAEIRRVLRPGGCCFFSARNLWGVIFRDNWRPFLTRYIPRLAALAPARDSWERRAGHLHTYPELKALVSGFVLHDYTWRVLSEPRRYGFDGLARWEGLMRLVPEPLRTALLPLLPNHLWILQKQD
jgi:ubiquinone/menaquinone biosynthesis C-methylase UbiE